MNHFSHLKDFNPIQTIVGHGSKVVHPAGRSGTISQNVETVYKKDFPAFHKNLKDLVMLYKSKFQIW